MANHLPLIIEGGRLKELPAGETLTPSSMQSLIDDNAVSGNTVFSSQHIYDLLYPFAITSFTVSPSSGEMGQAFTSETLNWATVGAPDTVSLNQGIGAVTLPATSYVHSPVNVTTNRTYTITAVKNGVTKTANASVSFLNRVYYGTYATQTTSEAIIKAMTSQLSNSRGRSITYNCSGGQYFHVAYPTRLGVATFSVGGLTYSDMTQTTINLTNAFGYMETYYVYYCNVIQYGASIPLTVI